MRSRLKELERIKKAGNDAFSSGRYDEAIERYTEAIAVDPDNVDLNLTLYTNRATAKFKSGNFTGAMEDTNTALEIQPRHLKALLRRAACKLELEDSPGAISDYEEAREIEPKDQSIKQSLHQAKVELK